MHARKGNGTATGEFSTPKPAHPVGKLGLLPPQQNALEALADKSRTLRKEWVEVRRLDPRPVRKLEEKHLIVTTESAGVMSARLTALGWQQSGLEKPEFEATRPVVVADEDDFEAAVHAAAEEIDYEKAAVAQAESLVQIANRPKVGVRPFGAPAETPVLVQLAEADPRPPVVDFPDDDEPEDDPADGLSDEMPEFMPVRKPVEYDCGPGCIHEHVMVLLREMNPEIREAAEILRQAKVIERRLGL